MIFINPHKCCTFVTEKSCLTSNANLCIIQKLKLLPSHYLYWGETLVNRSFLAIRHILADFLGKTLPLPSVWTLLKNLEKNRRMQRKTMNVSWFTAASSRRQFASWWFAPLLMPSAPFRWRIWRGVSEQLTSRASSERSPFSCNTTSSMTLKMARGRLNMPSVLNVAIVERMSMPDWPTCTRISIARNATVPSVSAVCPFRKWSFPKASTSIRPTMCSKAFVRSVCGRPTIVVSVYILSRCSELVYIELSYYFVPTAVLKKERSGLRDWWKTVVGAKECGKAILNWLIPTWIV